MSMTKAERAQYQRKYRGRNKQKMADYQRDYNKEKKRKLTSRGGRVIGLQRIKVKRDYTRSDMQDLSPSKLIQVINRMACQEARLAV